MFSFILPTTKCLKSLSPNICYHTVVRGPKIQLFRFFTTVNDFLLITVTIRQRTKPSHTVPAKHSSSFVLCSQTADGPVSLDFV